MCGIAGFAGRFDPSLLNRMGAKLAHRGPDDCGTYFDRDNSIGLSHRRLAIIDVSSAGHQPMWDCDKRVVITFNGEIYNYKELKRELVSEGFKFHSSSDTEVLLNMYLRDGPNCVEKLNGIFAFAIWDTRSRQLFLARDGLGVKPLYYSASRTGFVFASEIKALLCERTIDRSLDVGAVEATMSFLWSPAPRTVFKHIKKLRPGEALLVSGETITRAWSYYQLPSSPAIDIENEQDAENLIQNTLRRAVRRQLVSDVPVGAMLSGGLDSSGIVAFAREAMPENPIECFAIGFRPGVFDEEGQGDDQKYATQVAKHLGLPLEILSVGPEIIDALETMIYHLDEPNPDPAPLNVLLISTLARSHGIKVLLSGTGGDDLFGGYRRHLALTFEQAWSNLPKFARTGIAGIARSISQQTLLRRRFAKAFWYAHLGASERLEGYFRWCDSETLASLRGPALLDCADSEGLVVADRLDERVAPLDSMLRLDVRHFLGDHNLNYVDKLSMAAGVEVRVPFLDNEMVSLAFSIPPQMKVRHGIGKRVLRNALAQYVPESVLTRSKVGFGAPVRHWIRNELRALVNDTLSASSLSRAGLFNPTGVQRLLKLDREGVIDGSNTIFSLVCLTIWHRMFVESHD
jgi:asparagine synthase (glutamine-hydrolysing)